MSDARRNAFQPSTGSCFQVQSAGLITTDNSSRARTCSIKRNSESCNTSKIGASSNGHNDRRLSQVVERIWGDNQNRTCPLLLMSFGRIESNKIDISALHQISSLPCGGEVVHRLSVLSGIGEERSHWSSNSCNEYRFVTSGSTTIRPFSTDMLTADPDCSCTRLSMAGGTASITEPPTFLRVLVYIFFPLSYIFI